MDAPEGCRSLAVFVVINRAEAVRQWVSYAAFAAQLRNSSRTARTQVEGTMNAFVSMDIERFKAGLADDVVSFEMDLENKPVRFGSRNEVVRWAEATFAELKKMGASLKLDIHSSNCRATSTLAYCTVEFDLKATMTDGSTMSQPSRNSVVLRNGEDGWKWAHWHSSPAVPPAPPASPAQK